MTEWGKREFYRLLAEGVLDVKFILENKPDIRYIYVLESNGLFKIGYARYPKRRLASIHCGSPSPVRLVLTIPTDEYMYYEAALHAYFRAKHHHGEWFSLTEADIETIRRSEHDPKILNSVDMQDPRIPVAVRLRSTGSSLREVADTLNVSKSTASRLARS